ncbi:MULTISPECIES: ABC transporter ATP-binding protein [unclassified Nonomuraea]|uniref:ABC transporter ATP-binding protein n=1 Tax=unclassified Nonomuraea TaxID=2593643 RepID=UPI00340031E0
MTVVMLRDVTRVHGDVHALKGVSLEVSRGELVAVMGSSGSGKSTLLNVAGGLDRPSSGSVTIGDTDLAAVKDLAALRRREVGYVFQDLNLIPSLTAAENVMLPRELDGVRTGRARAEAMTVLAEVGVEEVADRFPEELSGGQRQRVAIARALAGERSVLLADEPTGALDTATGDDILGLLRERCDAGAAVLLVTHESRYAGWADRVVYLRDGEIVEAGAVRLESAR